MRQTTLLAIGLLVIAQALAQDTFIDEGACPGEGCVYGESWVARSRVRLHNAPNLSAPFAGTVLAGEAVQTVSGEVHTRPGRFIIHRSHDEFAPGDEVFLYTYLGEGWFRLRHNGLLKVADLGFSPWGGTSGKRCELDSRCWGSLQQELYFEWWVKVRTEEGLEGWTLDASDFDQPTYH